MPRACLQLARARPALYDRSCIPFAMDLVATLAEKLHVKMQRRLKPPGHIYQPHGTVARSYSIPSKYKCILGKPHEQRGFLTQEPRFVVIKAAVPGPAAYDISVPINHTSASISVNGTCGFASQTQRQTCEQIKAYPASNSYYLPSIFDSSKKKCSVVYASTFTLPVLPICQTSTQPGPASYYVDNAKSKIRQASRKQPPFLSSTERGRTETTSDRINFPGPGHYSIEQCTKSMTSNSNAASSVFKSKSLRSVLGEGTMPPNSNKRIWHATAFSLLNKYHKESRSPSRAKYPMGHEQTQENSFGTEEFREIKCSLSALLPWLGPARSLRP
ncbi:hypothetical protein AAHC03_016498 [Spirometra sp. Aus1]